MADVKLDQLARAFCDCTLPKGDWTHEAHLRVGLWHLLQFSPEESLERLRGGIRRYNEATGVANTMTTGYHETVTRFYVRVIEVFLSSADRTLPVDDLAEMLIARYGDRQLAYQFWSRARLQSPEARLGWVSPDLKPLDELV